MTYQDLLVKTAKRKEQARKELSAALGGKGGFLVKAEIERKPGSVAWLWLAKEFCEELAEHVGEWISDDPWDFESKEIGDIHMAYEDNDPDLYDLLPVEAQLFTD